MNSKCFPVEGGVSMRMSLEVPHLALVWLIYLLSADRVIKPSDTVPASWLSASHMMIMNKPLKTVSKPAVKCFPFYKICLDHGFSSLQYSRN